MCNIVYALIGLWADGGVLLDAQLKAPAVRVVDRDLNAARVLSYLERQGQRAPALCYDSLNGCVIYVTKGTQIFYDLLSHTVNARECDSVYDTRFWYAAPTVRTALLAMPTVAYFVQCTCTPRASHRLPVYDHRVCATSQTRVDGKTALRAHLKAWRDRRCLLRYMPCDDAMLTGNLPRFSCHVAPDGALFLRAIGTQDLGRVWGWLMANDLAVHANCYRCPAASRTQQGKKYAVVLIVRVGFSRARNPISVHGLCRVYTRTRAWQIRASKSREVMIFDMDDLA
ncbi:hypothetical protein CYMTET_3087 [Cymbomonas tetramitiformis]|uniref:Uncharacterized protein n=1 Tax=Cymbomonas tetramitiformis TaxID=36881 RepID=A0AAE0LLQ8_9CHLO|nr:hypothetical protein CYMTET_3087 [Cymbomonas tetramitiformis]